MSSRGRPWERWIANSTLDVVAVHIRRGDYLDKPLVHTNLHRTSYHQRAVDLLSQRITRSLAILIFSDDITWCERNPPLITGHKVRYVRGLDPYTDLYLQTQCDHHVIANSSFSWWGAWLAIGPNQEVVAPAEWFGPEGPSPHHTVYCDRWTVL